MPRLTALDEQLVHQLPEPFPNVVTSHEHWRESIFFVAHHRERLDDLVILTIASYPHRQAMQALLLGRVKGEQILGMHARPFGDDPHTADVGAARVEIVKAYEEVRLWADPEAGPLGIDLTFRARTAAYGLRRGTMKAGDEIIWDQSHMLQSGTYSGTYTVAGTTYAVDDWWGQRDHSWGIRDHGRCPLWLWFQVQLPDGFLGVWHWEYANGARVYTDGCWAPAGRGAPVAVVDFSHSVEWVDSVGDPVPYGGHGERVAGLRGSANYTLEDGRSITVEAEGSFDRPYEPFYRGGLNQMKVRTDDGRQGTAIFEVTGARHHRYFPDTEVAGSLPE